MWVDCPECGKRFMRVRTGWTVCLRCEGPPTGTYCLHEAYDRVREGADEDEVLEAAGYLVDHGEAEWADEDEWPHLNQLGLDER